MCSNTGRCYWTHCRF